VEVAGATHVGRVRERNEDAFHVDEAAGLLVVADGLGGHPAGDIASRLAVENLASELSGNGSTEHAERLVSALHSANDAIVADADGDRSRYGMGTTAVVAHVEPDERTVWIAHVGDSRAYHCRDGRLHQVTEDHTTGGIFGRGQITQALGSSNGVDPDHVSVDLKAGDRLLLCTDGLTDMLDDDGIAEVLRDGLAAEETCEQLVGAALARGGSDNITVVVVDIVG
jgi:PPM family protein phosphatase